MDLSRTILFGERTTLEQSSIIWGHGPHIPGRNDKNPAPNKPDKLTLVRRMVDFATVAVKFAEAVLQLFGP